MTDFIKASEEPQARAVAEDQRRAAEARAREAAATRVDAPAGGGPVETPVADLRDGTRAVNSETGSINAEHAPADPNVSSGQAEQAQGDQDSSTQTEEHAPQTVLASAKSFEKKGESFFGADTEKGFWRTLDRKMHEAFRGGEPEDVAINMGFAAVEFLVELVANWADHYRKDKKGRKKAYEDAVAAHDHDMGVTPLHKNMAIWAAIADHPAMRPFQDKPITADTIRTAYRVYQSDKTAQKAAIAILQSMTGREFTKDDANKAFESAFKAKLGGNSLQDIKGLALNDEKIMTAINLSGIRDQLQGMHQRNLSHEAQVAENTSDRSVLRSAEQQRQASVANVRSAERTI